MKIVQTLKGERMGEKRFEFYSDEDLIGVLDTVTGRAFNSFEVVDLLNERETRIDLLEKGILDCLFEDKSIGMFALEMGLVDNG